MSKLNTEGSMLGYEAVTALYLDYVNNFLTIEKFASHHGITPKDATALLQMGKAYGEFGSVHH